MDENLRKSLEIILPILVSGSLGTAFVSGLYHLKKENCNQLKRRIERGHPSSNKRLQKNL